MAITNKELSNQPPAWSTFKATQAPGRASGLTRNVFMNKIGLVILVFVVLSGCNYQSRVTPVISYSPVVSTPSMPLTPLPTQSSEEQQLANPQRDLPERDNPTPCLIAPNNTPANYDDIEDLFLFHGWSIVKTLGHHEVILPATFLHFAGDFPFSIYWAYNNELSSEAGLDFKPYLGTPVQAVIYKIEGAHCLDLDPGARGIVLLSGGKIIGGWVDSGTNLYKSCALNGKIFQEIVDIPWGEWLVTNGIVDMKNEIDNELSMLSPDQLVLSFYEAINNQELNLAYAHYTREGLAHYLFTNLQCCIPGGEGELYHHSFEEALGVYGIENIKFVEINEVTMFSSSPGNIIVKVVGEISYYRESPPLISDTATYLRFVILKQDIDGLGYRISDIGTGP